MRFGPLMLMAMWLMVPRGAWAEPVRQNISALPKAEIVGLQRRLTDAGCYAGPIDGMASEATQAAVLACPDQRPRLVIETGMHVALVNSISVNKACSQAATASEDKTLRLWSLPDGRLLHTIRPPIGDGNLGKIFTASSSPDGRFVVAGGWDAHREIKSGHSINVFDPSNGSLVTRLGPYGNVILNMTFSPDGKSLAVNIADLGLAIFNTSAANPRNWTEVAHDLTYKSDSYSAGWSGNGRLATVAMDGKLRLYGPAPDFRKIREGLVLGGKEPFSVAFDPSQDRLAVGYDDTTAVEIYDAQSLKRLIAADTTGIDNGDLDKVAWQADGKRLWAGGKYDIGGKYSAIIFDRNGKKIGKPVNLAPNSIQSLQPCASGMVFAGGGPVFGLLDEASGATVLHKTLGVDMHGKLGAALTVAADGKSVRFGLGYGSRDPSRFDLARSALLDAPAPDSAFALPRIAGLPVANWTDKLNPTFAQQPIVLQQHEKAHSLAIRTDGAGFMLGSDYSLRSFDAQGKQLWDRTVPAAVWGVNVSGDGRIIVAAYGDGTIRWHRWSDGQELLALFVNSQTKAWVAWTPTGYYSASPGGEDLIGWHVNRGWDQAADFFPADRFKAQFARADIVERILDTLDEAEAVKLANAAQPVKREATPLLNNLPPVISILSPAEGTLLEGAKVTIGYIIRSPSGLPVDIIEARVDGRPLALAQGIGGGEDVRKCLTETHGLGRQDGALQGCRGSITIDAPQNSAAIGLAARSGSRFSEAAILNVTRAATTADLVKPKLYALVIGVADYVNPDYKLGLPAKDAKDFASALQHQKGGLYSDVTVQVLTDRAATVAAIKDGLDWLTHITTARDVAVLYFAGHGEVEQRSGKFYLLPAEADGKKLFSTAISRDEINGALEQVPGKTIVFLDACHSGAIVAGSSARGLGAFNVNDVVKDMANADNGIVLFTASTGKQLSLENPVWGNGAFTKALVEGLGLEGIKAQAGLTNKGTITLSELEVFVAERVKQLTEGAQSPVLINPKGVPNYPLALAR